MTIDNTCMNYLDIVKNRDFFSISSENINNIENSFYGYRIDKDAIYIRNIPNNLEFDKLASGFYVQIIKTNESINIYQDYFGGFGLYVYSKNEYWAISNSIIYLIENLPDNVRLTINNEYFGAYFVHQVITPSITETIINEIYEVPPGKYVKIYFENKIIELIDIEYDKFSIDISSREGMDLIEEWWSKYHILLSIILADNYNVIADLSGGFDSRVVFSFIKDANLCSHNLRINTLHEPVHTQLEDYKIALKIAEIFNFKLNNDLSTEGQYLDSIDAVALSFYVKAFCTDEMYYNSICYNKPIFHLVGGAAELVRNYAPYSAEQYISKYIIFPKLLQLDLKKDAINLLKRVFKYLSSNYPDDLYDAQKLYNYIRARNLNARSYVEAFLCNMITISPFMDPILLKLDLTNSSVEDRNILHAILLNRFLPELENVPFNGGRNIAQNTINKAIYLNRQFNRNLYIGQQSKKEEYIRNQFTILDKADNLNPCIFAKEKQKPTDYILNIYKSENCKNYLMNKFNYQLYRYGIVHYRHNKYISERFITKIVFIYSLSRMIDNREIFPKYVLKEYSSNGVVFDLVRLLSTSRFDVINEGNGNTLDVVFSNDCNLVCDTPRWFSSSRGEGKSFYTLKNDFNMTIKVNGAGKITFIFLSLPYRLANGRHFNNMLDYTNIVISDTKTGMILNQCKSAFGICHDHNKTLSCEVLDQQLLSLKFFFKPHDYIEGEILDLIKQFYDDYFNVSF